MKRLLLAILIMFVSFSPAFCAEEIKAHGNMAESFYTEENAKQINFYSTEEIKVNDDITIPKNSLITAEVVQVQKESRWHKSGYVLCKILSFKPELSEEKKDISDTELYAAIRKYEKIYGKDATILWTEIIVTQAAAIVGSCFIYFAPVDIAYFFTKGAIKKDKHPHWFMSGVSSAYDNSVCWFWLKGKSIDLNSDDAVEIKEIKTEKALKLEKQIAKRNQKAVLKKEKKALKLQKKEQKRLLKEEKKKQKKDKV